MKRLKQLFKDSFRELKDTRKMAMAAMFVAIAVILGIYRLQLTEFIRIGFDFLPKEMAAMLLGPLQAAWCSFYGYYFLCA